MKIKVQITAILLVLSAITAMAQTSFTLNTPRNQVEGTRFTITFSLKNASGHATEPKAPELAGCKLLYNQAGVSTMQSYQVINGVASSSTTTEYTFSYRAEKAGTVTVPAVTVTVDGKEYTSRATSFTILPPDKSASQSAGQGGGGNGATMSRRQTSSDFNVGKNDVLIRVILSRNSVYEQEPVECTIKLYTKYNISSFTPKTQPNFDGCLIEDLTVPAYLDEREHYNGENYYVAVLKRCLLYPQRSGALALNSGQYDLTVQRQVIINDWPFPRSVIEEKNITVNSNAATINVTPLPQPAPAGFNGAVGHFSIDSRLVGTSFKTNEAATLLYTITGTGNIKYLQEPAIDFPSEFEVYTPRSESDTHVSGANMTGKMTVEYTFVPQSVGKFTIGEDSFVYFDPTKRDYTTLTTPAYAIDVKQGANVTASSTGTDKQDITSKNTDIHHIKLGDKAPRRDRNYIALAGWYWPAYLVLFGAAVLIVVLYRRSAAAASDTRGRKLARANKVARRRLRMAGSFLKAKNYEKFYEELLRAIWGYLGDKLSLPASQLTRDNISAMLSDYGASPELIDNLINVIDNCEMARYTPQLSADDADAVYDRAGAIINQMESIKRKS